MADDLDRASELEEQHRQLSLAARPAFELVPGVPGECDLCGQWSGRLVQGACAPCRDRFKLP